MDKAASHLSGRIDLSAVGRFRLGLLVVDPAAHEIMSGEQREHLQPQPLKVLVALARRRGEVVTREQLIEACWDGRYVGDDVVNRAILLLRALAKKLGGFSIETVPKAGYRLRELPAWRERFSQWHAPVLVFAIVIIIGIVAYALRPGGQADPPTPRVALLPFSHGGDPTTAAVASGIGNSLVHMLSDSSLPVERADSAAAATANVDFLLIGDVRSGPSSIIVTMHLEDARDGAVLFSKDFRARRERATGLPEQVGAYAAANLTWSGTLRILDERQALPPSLTTALLKQLFLTVEDGDWLRAYEITAQVAPQAPDSTMAQLGLAHNAGLILARLPLEQRAGALHGARAAAKRARELSPGFGDVYTPSCRLYPSEWHVFCEDELRKGLRIDPDAPYVSPYLRRMLGEVGRNREALQYARMSLANDPYKPGKLGGLIGRLEALNQRAEAAERFNAAVRWWPTKDIFYRERVDGMAQRGDLDAVARFAEQSPASLFPVDRQAAMRLADAVRDRRQEDVRALCKWPSTSGTMATLCLVALTQVGEIDGAFDLAPAVFPPRIAATRSEEERIWLADPVRLPTAYLTSPALAPMRRDPRFIDLARSTGLLRYWRTGRLPDFCRAQPEPVCAQLRGQS